MAKKASIRLLNFPGDYPKQLFRMAMTARGNLAIVKRAKGSLKVVKVLRTLKSDTISDIRKKTSAAVKEMRWRNFRLTSRYRLVRETYSAQEVKDIFLK